MAEVSANLKFARVGTQKARLVADVVRGKSVDKALMQLEFLDRKSAELIKKLILSAVATARQDPSIAEDNLFITKILVDRGPHYKRQIPRAQGKASLIRKKTSHIHLVLAER